MVIEGDLAVLDLVLEMDVGGALAQLVGDIGQREIVRGDQADGAALHQAAHQRRGADPPVVRVGAVQELVDQEQHGQRPGRLVQNLAQAQDLGVEARDAALQRIGQPDGGADRQRREPSAAARAPERRPAPAPHSRRGCAASCSCPTCWSR